MYRGRSDPEQWMLNCGCGRRAHARRPRDPAHKPEATTLFRNPLVGMEFEILGEGFEDRLTSARGCWRCFRNWLRRRGVRIRSGAAGADPRDVPHTGPTKRDCPRHGWEAHRRRGWEWWAGLIESEAKRYGPARPT